MTVLESSSVDPQVLTMCEKYRYEELHSHRVADLALRLYELLEPLHGLGSREAHILRHAALLHDIGHFIHRRGHHKHSAYLIRNDAALAGFADDERELIATVARNHRKRPRINSAAYGARWGRTALQLSAILRLADWMDYPRTGAAVIHSCEITNKAIRLVIDGIDDPAVREAEAEKTALVKPAFGRKLAWRPSEQAPDAEPQQPPGAE